MRSSGRTRIPVGRTPYRLQFVTQRYKARLRGIEWELSFKQWLEIWRASGHLNERGNDKDSYVMARYEDQGPYASYNVKIITKSQNHKEYHETLHSKKT